MRRVYLVVNMICYTCSSRYLFRQSLHVTAEERLVRNEGSSGREDSHQFIEPESMIEPPSYRRQYTCTFVMIRYDKFVPFSSWRGLIKKVREPAMSNLETAMLNSHLNPRHQPIQPSYSKQTSSR